MKKDIYRLWRQITSLALVASLSISIPDPTLWAQTAPEGQADTAGGELQGITPEQIFNSPADSAGSSLDTEPLNADVFGSLTQTAVSENDITASLSAAETTPQPAELRATPQAVVKSGETESRSAVRTVKSEGAPAEVYGTKEALALMAQPASIDTAQPQTVSPEAALAEADVFDGVKTVDVKGWQQELPNEYRSQNLDQFPDFYRAFVKELNRQFVSEYRSDREHFLQAVAENRFQAKLNGIGELETKYISGQVAVRFVSRNPAAPLVVLWVNVPLQVNVGSRRIAVHADPAQVGADKTLDPPLADRHLDKYRSRLLIDRKVDFSRLLQGRSLGGPHRAVLIVDQADGTVSDTAFSPALQGLSRRWLGHWAKGTLEKARYGDYFRGTISASIQFALGFGFALLGQVLHPVPHSFFLYVLGPALVSGAFAWTFAVFTDSYIAFVQRGDNRTWESIKRLLIGAILLSYPLAIMQAGGNLGAIFTLQTTIIVWLVGFGDRYVSTVTNVIPKIHQKYSMKPWWFPKRVRVPLSGLAARLTGNPDDARPVKGVTFTREALAIPRFAIKFVGLFLDPVLMHWTFGIPVATVLLWLSGLAFEVFNYHAFKKLAEKNPSIREDWERYKKRYAVFSKIARRF